MTKEFIGKEIKEGALIVDETDYNRLRYRTALALPSHYAEKHREIQQHYRDIEKLGDEIKDYVRNDFRPNNMPTGMTCMKIEIEKDYVYAEWESDKVSIVRVTRNNPNPPAPPAPRCPYLDLANRGDFKQILSSGILSKEERRKCLGLPALTEETSNA